jgi:hypothetical protein
MVATLKLELPVEKDLTITLTGDGFESVSDCLEETGAECMEYVRLIREVAPFVTHAGTEPVSMPIEAQQAYMKALDALLGNKVVFGLSSGNALATSLATWTVTNGIGGGTVVHTITNDSTSTLLKSISDLLDTEPTKVVSFLGVRPSKQNLLVN